MKKIIIVRHAKSSWTEIGLSDFIRPLDKRGLHDAPLMAKRLQASGHIPDVIYSSDAVRAKSTASYFSHQFNVAINEVRSLYHGQPDDYLNVIHELDENIKTIALFGHNPGITFIANLIKRGSTDNIPTCGVIIAESSVKSWKEISWEKMDMIDLLYPKDGHYV